MFSIFKRRNVDMLQGPILKNLVTFGIPIFIGSVFQQLYNMVDSIIVGRFVGSDALAAVGATSSMTMLFVGLAMGFTTGASVLASQLIGARRFDKIKSAISTTMVFLVGLIIAITAAGLLLTDKLLVLIQVPENIIADAALYFRIYLIGLVFMMLYNAFAAFLRAFGDSTTPLIFLALSSVLNIFGDLAFVIFFDMGVAGVGIATVLAQAISVVLCFFYTRRNIEHFKFAKGEFVFDTQQMRTILRLGIPAALQGSVSGLGFTLVQGLINSYGSVSIAAYTAASKMENLCNLPMQSMSMSLSLFVGQNIGAGNIERTKKGLRTTVMFSAGLSIAMSALVYIFGSNMIMLFVDAAEAEIITTGTLFMRRWAPFVFLHAVSQCFSSLLRGAGDAVPAMISMMFDLATRLVMAYVLALGLGLGFMGIAYAIPCGWAASGLVAGLRYLSGRWQTKAVVTAQAQEEAAGAINEN